MKALAAHLGLHIPQGLGGKLSCLLRGDRKADHNAPFGLTAESGDVRPADEAQDGPRKVYFAACEEKLRDQNGFRQWNIYRVRFGGVFP